MIRVFENRGRDIAPKLVGFRDVYDRYEFMLHLHSKETPHVAEHRYWRQYLLETLVGSTAIVRSVFEIFSQAPKVGIVAPQHFELVAGVDDWGPNFSIGRQLAARMGFDVAQDNALDFPSGSMFWARAAALKPLMQLNLSFADFPPESGQIDGTISHAIERLYFFAAEKSGFDWLKISRPEFLSSNAACVRMSGEEDLEAYAKNFAVRLLDARPGNAVADRVPGAAPATGLLNCIQSRSLGAFAARRIKNAAVGIVTYNNAAETLTAAISAARIALAAAGCKPRIYILDNGETSETAIPADACVARLPPVGNIGFAAGHNRLMRQAFDEGAQAYVALNPDGLIEPSAIDSMLGVLSANCGRALIDALEFPVEHFKPYDPYTLATPWATGACLLIAKGVFAELGGFDETFFMYCEDVDLSWRCRASGIPVKTCPTALFLHAVPNRMSLASRRRATFESALKLAHKWGAPAAFSHGMEKRLIRLGGLPPDVRPARVPEAWRQFVDFEHDLDFAAQRW